MPTARLSVWLAGRIDFEDYLRVAERLSFEVAEPDGCGPTLLLCEHADVITLGRLASRRDVELTDVGEPPVPKIEIYFRGTAQPYQAMLEDPGPLETIFLASSFEVEDEPFVHFLDGEGEAVFFRSEQVVLLTYYWEEVKRNRSVVHRVIGPSPDDASLRGEWRIQVWQSERDEGWYADLEFATDDEEPGREVETYGPCEAKTEAAEVARKGLEGHWLNPPASPVF